MGISETDINIDIHLLQVTTTNRRKAKASEKQQQCTNQQKLSGVFKSGDFNHNTSRRLLIDVTSSGWYQQTTHSKEC